MAKTRDEDWAKGLGSGTNWGLEKATGSGLEMPQGWGAGSGWAPGWE